MMRNPAVLVVGGGPAGSVTAGLLSRRGHDVLLVDRSTFPRPKPCGECLNPGAVQLLRELGLLDAVEALSPARLEGWWIRTGPEVEAGGGFGDGSRYGLALRRSDLDATLLQWARVGGTQVIEDFQVTRVDTEGEENRPRVSFRDAEGRKGDCRPAYVIGADGLRSVVARSSGLVRRRPGTRKLSLTCHVIGEGPDPSRGHLYLTPRGVLGMAPLSSDGGCWNLSVVVDARKEGRRIAANPAAFHREFGGSVGVPWVSPPKTVAGPWASGPFDWPVRQANRGRIVLVGDAAGYYDPLTGQGIYRALRSAVMAEEAVDRALRSEFDWERHLERYGRAWARETTPSRRVQHGIEYIVRRQRLLRPLLKRAGRSEGSLTGLLRVTGDLARPRTLLRPAAWMPLVRGGTTRG